MKKLLYSFLAVSLIFSSCKKEEGCTDSIATNYNADAKKDDGSCTYDILGVWDVTEYSSTVSSGYYTTYPDGEKIISNTSSETFSPGDTSSNISSGYFNFKSNGELIRSFVLINLEDTFSDTMTWVQDGKQLTVTNENSTNQVYIFTINALSYSSLSLTYFKTDTNTINNIVYFNESNESSDFEKSTLTTNKSNVKIIKNSNQSLFQFIGKRK